MEKVLTALPAEASETQDALEDNKLLFTF